MADHHQRGNFAAVPTNAPHSPPVLELCRLVGDRLADSYYFRTLCFCKDFCPTGQLVTQWYALARSIDWRESPDALKALFRKAGLVSGSLDELYQWDLYNGWLIRRRLAENEKKKKQRARGKKAARTKRLKRRAALKAVQLAADAGTWSPTSKETPESLSVCTGGTSPGTSPGLSPGQKLRRK